MKPYLSHWLLSFSLIVLLASCQADPTPSTQISKQYRLKTVKRVGDQQTLLNTYNYDSKGKLISIDVAFSDRRKTSYFDAYYTCVFTYDGTDKVIQAEYQPDNKKFVYEYDATGNVKSIKISAPSSWTRTYSLAYNASNDPVKIVGQDDYSSQEVIEYTYKEGNIITIKKAFVSNIGTVTDESTTAYQFDNKPNPFYNLYTGIFDSQGSRSYNIVYQNNTINQNNMICSGCVYEYDSNENIVKEDNKISGYVTTFTYEKN